MPHRDGTNKKDRSLFVTAVTLAVVCFLQDIIALSDGRLSRISTIHESVCGWCGILQPVKCLVVAFIVSVCEERH